MSKGTIGTFIGFAIGSVFGPAGAQIGAMIGSAIGSSFDTIEGRKVGEMASPRAQEGEPIPLVFGSARVTGRLMSTGKPDIRKEKEGGKGGPKVENETAYLSYSILICESSELRNSSITGILMVVENNEIVYDVRPTSVVSAADNAKWLSNKIFYYGGEAQGVDPTEQMIHGTGNVPAYRGLARMVVTDEDVTQHGGSVPTYEFVTTQCVAVAGGTPWLSVFGSAANQTVKVSPDGEDWTAAGETPSIGGGLLWTPGGARLIHNGGYVVGTTASAGAKLVRRAPDGTWATATGIGEIDASSGDLLHSGSHWIIGKSNATSGGVTQRSLRSVDGLAYENIPGPYNADEAQNFKGYCIAATNSKIYGFAPLSTTGWLYTLDLDGTNQARLPDLPAGYNLGAARMASDGTIVGLVGSQASNATGILKINGSTYTAIANPFPTADVTNNYTISYALGNWIVTRNNRVAIGTTLDNLVLQAKVFSGFIFGAGSDGLKFIACGQAGMMEKWTPTGGWVALNSGVTTDIYDVVALGGVGTYSGVPIPDAPDYYIDPDTGVTSGPATTTYGTCTTTLQTIVDKLDARAGIPTANLDSTDLALIDVPGYAVDTFMTVADAKEPLRRVWFFDCPEWDDKIRYRLRGKATDFTVNPDDLIEGEDAFEKGVRGQTVEFPRRLHVQYVDPAPGYKPMKQTAERISPDIRVKGEVVAGANITLTADTAKRAADIGIKSAWAEREDSREIVLPIDYWNRAKAAHTYTLDGRRYRITELRLEAGAIYIQSVYDRTSAYTSAVVGTAGPAPTAPPSKIIGPTDFVVMNLPALRDSDDSPGLYYAARGYSAGWAGARLQMIRNYLWETVANINTPCVMGTLLASLPVASRDVIDETNAISVRMSGTLDSVTYDVLLNESNVLAILYPDSTAEIVQFQTAVETAPGEYSLTTLIRGRLDTAIASHAIGAQVVLLNNSVRFFELTTSDLDFPSLTFRNVANGLPEADATQVTLTNTLLESVREWPVADVVWTRDAGSNLVITWIGRARIGTDAIPVHSRFFTGYIATVANGATTKSWATTLQSAVISSADQVSIFGNNTFTPAITVAPTSTVTGGEVGDGLPFPAALAGWTSTESGWSYSAGKAVYDPAVSGVSQSMLRYTTPLPFVYDATPPRFYASCDVEAINTSAGSIGYALYSGSTFTGRSGAGTLNHPHSTVSAGPIPQADGIAPAVYAFTNGVDPVSFSNVASSITE